jgi:hypothetical protein
LQKALRFYDGPRGWSCGNIYVGNISVP